MPISITSKEFTQSSFPTLTYYQANAGDSTEVVINLVEIIRAESSLTNIFGYNASTKIITWATGNFLQEGFQVGDEIIIEVVDSSGVVIATSTVDIQFLEATQLKHTGTITWYDSSAGENVSITLNYKKTGDKRTGLLLEVNHVNNGASGSPASLIDGEFTRFNFDLTNTSVSPNVNGIQVGNKSGQFATFCNITDTTTYPSNSRTYELVLGVIQSGIYEQSNFNFADCLKLYLNFNFQREYGNPNDSLSYVFNDQADTGWFDEPYNSQINDATLIQGINSLEYDTVQTGTIQIDSASLLHGFGASYIPTDEDYYKNQPYSQSELGMTAPSTISAVYPFTITAGFPNPDGANYTIEFSNQTYVGTTYSVDWEFTPNADFIDFMDNRADGDRLFYIWAKVGNLNLLLFADQLFKQEKPGDPLNMIVHDFTDHSENYTDTLITENGFTGNIEDDIAFIGKFLVPINSVITEVNGYVEAYNSVTNDSFILQSALFSFGSVPLVFGYYPINSSQEIITTLQQTNVKREALLIRDSSIDTFTEYGIRIHFPFLYNWQYWIDQPNANGEFYPDNQTKNWLPYGTTTNWNLRFRMSANINGQLSEYSEDITIKDYDSDSNVQQEIKLIRDLDNTEIGIVVEGELHKIEAYHTLLNGDYWKADEIWGMITVEPTENSPRWVSSTVVPFDNNILNPLSPLSGLYCSLTFPTPDVAKLECYFDSNKINLENGVKFTTKIKGCSLDPAFFKLLTDGSVKYTTDGLPKLLTL